MEKISIPWKTVKGTWDSFLVKKFWEDGIMKLPEIWQKVVEQKGEYVVYSKVFHENEKCVLFFLKNLRHFLAHPILTSVKCFQIFCHLSSSTSRNNFYSPHFTSCSRNDRDVRVQESDLKENLVR